MKQVFKRAFLVCLSLILCMGSLGTTSYAANDNLMAYNIYSDPDTTGTSASWDTFAIDFRSSLTNANTYWALANWSMDLTASKKVYYGCTGGGAYAGLQNTTGGRKAILSFWEISYRNQKLRASRIYPAGTDNNFGGEGEGTNWITNYPWVDNAWYRMVLHCWEDAETGTTFVGQWFQDIQTGEWKLISYFDTHLYDSFFKGGMSQFMENYTAGTAENEREFNYKNLYGLDHKSGEWVSLNTSKLSYDAGATNKKGTHEFGATDEYFWGKTNGIVLEDQAAYNKTTLTSKKYTINQPDTPTFGTPAVETLTFQEDSGKWQVAWDMSSTGTPQLSYKVELIDLEGNVVQSQSATRPEVNTCTLDMTDDQALKCRVTVTDVFGTEIVSESETEAYTNGQSGDVDKEQDGEKNEQTPNSDENTVTIFSVGEIIAIVVAVVAVVAVVVVVIVLSKKKKSKKA